MFQYWLQGGRITVGFLGGAQVDRFGNLNSTVVGDYSRPKVRLPGSGGATEIATACDRIFIVMPQTPRAFVAKLDFLTSLGHGRTGRERAALGLQTQGPTLLVTDLCTMRPDTVTNEFEVVTIHPGITRDKIADSTGWPVQFTAETSETPAPTPHELQVLRDLNERTRRARAAPPQQ